MIRDGKYGLYNGQEYMLAGKKDDLEIISNDPAELLNGFIQDDWDENIFFKKIKKEDLDTAYEITTYAKYKGHNFGVLTASEFKVVIATNNPQVGHELNMSVPGRGEFHMEVNRTDVELIEEKKPIWGFTLDIDN
ncbi:hypothetical protein ACQVOU_23625 [Bacillus pacificus]|uniref:hypothetical protein n=1 Tax=Bacillus pacificus TaxID=2026187 RepID=UPI000665F0F0|nr:hypothetical protein AT277_00705 [Bacillus cereus]KXZ02213.1 hypothetical protein AT276_23020 [Bacillus cereus]MBL3795678.1 hypothetical protein [Bacillus cereus]MBL3858277.1 hypothetical protein [Bacillus cereus]HDR7968746.1 hypothetical protein [Bacillus pacificus]